MYRRLILLLVITLAMTALVRAQDITPTDNTEIDPNANITWPPPVYVLRGEVDIYGTAAVPEMSNYFIEFRPLEFEDDAETDATATTDADTEGDFEAPWFPVTLPSNRPITEDVLGTWNTETTDDGLYEIRLTVNVSGEPPFYFFVSPLRVENEPPAFVDLDDLDMPEPAVTDAPSRPTLAPTPTAADTTPMVIASVDSNVRTGDSTRYPVIGQLLTGTSARVVGISNTGSGWYYIELDDGDRGFIAPSIVVTSGDLSGVPRISPPPPPATATPTPTNTPLPSGNLAASPPSLNPGQPTCGQQFEVRVNVTNIGTANTGDVVTVLVQDIHVASGTVQTSFATTVPALEPGTNFVVVGNLTVSTFFNEEHRIVVTLDTTNAVTETNEADNVVTSTYTLAQGSCG